VLPPIKSAADIGPAMDAVISALAVGTITPGEAATIAAVVDTFARAIEVSDFERRLKIMEGRVSCAVRRYTENVRRRTRRVIQPLDENLL
jgi:ethanolamine utilization microcompartment shell protein EutS